MLFNKDIIIRKADPSNKSDIAFITIISRMFGKEVAVDGADLSSDNYIKQVFSNPSTRIIEYNNEYIAYTYLDDFENNLTASLHGFINKIDKSGRKTTKYLKLFAKYRVMEQIIEQYFNFYRSPAQKNCDYLEAYLPEFMQNYRIKGQFKTHPTAKLIIEAGFTLITNKPRRAACRKNNRPCAVFIYQLGRTWFSEWLNIQKEYVNTDITPEELSKKYNKREESILNWISRKKLIKRDK